MFAHLVICNIALEMMDHLQDVERFGQAWIETRRRLPEPDIYNPNNKMQQPWRASNNPIYTFHDTNPYYQLLSMFVDWIQTRDFEDPHRYKSGGIFTIKHMFDQAQMHPKQVHELTRFLNFINEHTNQNTSISQNVREVLRIDDNSLVFK